MIRTHEAGTLRAAHVGQSVTLTGWVARRRDHGGVAFIDLRDASGLAQVVLREDIAHELRNEFVIQVTGEVRLRPDGSANANLSSGEVEVVGASVVVLNTSAPTPFPIDEHVTVVPASAARREPARWVRSTGEAFRVVRKEQGPV